MPHLPNVEWNVYVNGAYVGTVFESSEELARCAAWSRFDPPAESSISVNRR